MKKEMCAIGIILVLTLVAVGGASAERFSFRTQGDNVDYSKFMHLRDITMDGTKKKGELERAMFAIGEFYFRENSLPDARQAFQY